MSHTATCYYDQMIIKQLQDFWKVTKYNMYCDLLCSYRIVDRSQRSVRTIFFEINLFIGIKYIHRYARRALSKQQYRYMCWVTGNVVAGSLESPDFSCSFGVPGYRGGASSIDVCKIKSSSKRFIFHHTVVSCSLKIHMCMCIHLSLSQAIEKWDNIDIPCCRETCKEEEHRKLRYMKVVVSLVRLHWCCDSLKC